MSIKNAEKIRQELIRYATKVDPLGVYTDEDSLENGIDQLTNDEAVSCLVEAILRYEHYMTVNQLL